MQREVLMISGKTRAAFAAALAVLAVATFASCVPKAGKAVGQADRKPARVVVFIPGVRAGNAIYDTMAAGVERAVAEVPGATVKVFEAGFNQAEWEEKLTSLVATGEYDLVVTSNPSMPELCAKVGASYPKQLFLALDGYLPGKAGIHTALYNQTEQGYLAGYLAGLVTTGSMKGSNKALKVGMVVGQHYPVMDKVIVPGFEAGLRAVDPGITVDLRVVGDWFDASKGEALAKDEIAAGADVILPICGGAAQGVYKAARDAGVYAVVFDDNQYAQAPGTILGCFVLRQEELAYVRTRAALDGALAWGTAEIVGVKEGYVGFLDDAPEYLSAVPERVRSKMAGVFTALKSGKLVLEVPVSEF
jgi:simple sugar transport system substrate-binding protein